MSFTQFPRYSSPLKLLFSRLLYDYISTLVKDDGLLFMNYGYANLDPTSKPLELLSDEEAHRYSIQLYHHVASAIDWTGMRALEISSGRGGGTWYIMRRYKPASIVGIDLSINAIDFCNRYYAMDGLSFFRGSADNLQFPNNTFDVVINIESSLYYANMEAFIKEVVRVLKPEGYFLYADIRYVEEIDRWRFQLAHPSLKLLADEDITPNVVKSMELNADHRRVQIEQYVPRLLWKPFGLFAGISGAGLARSTPEPRERIYLNFVFQKT